MEVITEEAAESSRHDIFLCSLHDFSKNVKAKTNRTFLRKRDLKSFKCMTVSLNDYGYFSILFKTFRDFSDTFRYL